MARSEARVSVGIWKDQDYRSLTFGGQWMYECLVSQSDLSYAGVLALRESRWARYACDLGTEQVEAFLAELAERRYVVMDEATGEVLVRSFMRHDEVWKQPNVLRASLRAIDEIESVAILAALVPEVERMTTLEGVTERVADLLAEMLKTLRARLADAQPKPDVDPSGNPSANPSRNPSGNPVHQDLESQGGGGRVTAVGSDSPIPPPPAPLLPPPAGADKPRRRTAKTVDPKAPSNAGAVVGAYVDAAIAAGYPRPGETIRARVGKQARALLAAPDADFDAVMAAAQEMARRGWQDLEVQMQRSSAESRGVGGSTPKPLPDEESLESEWRELRS